jgi:hypothetical protein
MNRSKIFAEIDKEIKRAENKFPIWPDDFVIQAAIVCEESGELLKATLDFRNCGGSVAKLEAIMQDIKMEAIQTAAMAIRFIENFPR